MNYFDIVNTLSPSKRLELFRQAGESLDIPAPLQEQLEDIIDVITAKQLEKDSNRKKNWMAHEEVFP